MTNLMADYLAYGLSIVCVPAVNQLTGITTPTPPGAAGETYAVAWLGEGVWSDEPFGLELTTSGGGVGDLYCAVHSIPTLTVEGLIQFSLGLAQEQIRAFAPSMGVRFDRCD